MDGVLQLRLAQRMGNPRHFADADGTPKTNDAGINDPVLGSAMMMPLLPMLEFLHPAGVVIDGRQDFEHRHEVTLGKELLHRAHIAFLLRRSTERKADFLEFD